MTKNATPVRIAAIGDLLLTTRPDASTPGRGLEALSNEIRQLFTSCDLVLGNLECTLPGGKQVPTEPRVLTTPEQLQGLRDSGISAVTLGNNHAFDAGNDGFQKLCTQLNDNNIAWFGAGLNQAKAIEPLVLNIKDLRIALLAAVDQSSGMSRFAEKNSSGVAPLNTACLCQQIKNLRTKVDHIIVTPHWGEERFRFPSPRQIEQAHAFIEAGATMVLGHHPHVLQGLEFHGQAPIAYSLGNFLANEVYWENGDTLTWNRFERTGCILLVELNRSAIHNIQQIPVFDDGSTIAIDTTGRGERYLQRANDYLKNGITAANYRRESFRVQALLPILSQLRWEKLRRVRPSHLQKAVKLLNKGLRT